MPKTGKNAEKKRITRKQANKLYPTEWVVFAEPRRNRNHTFRDGIVYFHGKDQAEAYRRSAEITGECAVYYTGSIPYRTVTFTGARASGVNETPRV